MILAVTLGGVSFLLAIIWGGVFVRLLRHFGIGKKIRIEGPQSHFTKMGTPTMGGILILASVLVVTMVAHGVLILRQQEIAEAVVIPLVTQHYRLLQRNVLYTAVSRGQQLVVLVGTKRAIDLTIANNDIRKRYTGLPWRLSQAWEKRRKAH